jgi:hypothetical protein
LERGGDCRDQIRWSSGFDPAEAGFDFAPHFLDGIQIRGVGGKEQDLGPRLLDQPAGSCVLMGREVVHDHDVARPQSGAQDLADVGLENFRVRGALDGHAGSGAVQTDRTDHGGGVPVAVGSAGVDTLSARSATAQTGQVGFGARFVQEDQPGRVEAGLPPPPRTARPDNVRTVLFAGPESLFLYVRPIFFRT